MNTCDQCGGEIIFRYINGGRIPIHLSGGCYGRTHSNTSSQLENHGGYNLTSNYHIFHNTLKWHYHDDDYTRATICPIKGCYPVYFVRHNGGSVWFDSLGKPWPKHPCFDRVSEPAKSYNIGEYGYNTTFKTQQRIKRYSAINNAYKLGVVIVVKFNARRDEYRLTIKDIDGNVVDKYMTAKQTPKYMIGEMVMYLENIPRLICLGIGITISLIKC